MAELHERIVTRAPKKPGEPGRKVKVWVVRWRGPDGKMVQETFASDNKSLKAPKSAAEARQQEIEDHERLAAGKAPPPRAKAQAHGFPFRDVAERWLQTREALKREQATLADYRAGLWNHVIPWLEMRGRGDVRHITIHDVRDFRDDLVADGLKSKKDGRPLGIVAKRKLLKLMKTVLRQAVEDGIIPGVPGDQVFIETPSDLRNREAEARADRVFQPAEVRSLLAAAEDLAETSVGLRRRAWNEGGFKALVVLMCLSGLRISEALAIQIKHLDLDHGTLKVRHGIDRYSNIGPAKRPASIRTVDLHVAAVAAIRDYLRLAGMEQASPNALLFSTGTGQPLNPSNIFKRCWSVLLAHANKMALDPRHADRGLVVIEDRGVGWHGLRRWANSWLIQQGVDRQQVRALMGHTSETMTARYTFALDEVTDVIRQPDVAAE